MMMMMMMIIIIIIIINNQPCYQHYHNWVGDKFPRRLQQFFCHILVNFLVSFFTAVPKLLCVYFRTRNFYVIIQVLFTYHVI